MRTAFGVLGVIVGLFSAFLVTTALVEIASGGNGKTPMSVLVGMLVFFAGALAASGYLSWRMFRGANRGAKSTTPALAEQRVLALVAKLGGRTTVAEAAARCGLTIGDSRATLERLVSQGVAEMLIAADGTMVYAVLGLLTPEAKAAADDVLAS